MVCASVSASRRSGVPAYGSGGELRSKETHTREFAIYADLAKHAARDNGPTPERMLK